MALVNANGQDSTAGVVIIGVGGRVAVLVHDPANRHIFLAVPSQCNLTQCHCTGGHIHQNWTVQVARHADAHRIRTQLSGYSPKRGNVLGRSAGVGCYQANHVLCGHHGRVVTQSADVALVIDRDCADTVSLSLLYCQFSSLFSLYETKSPIAVNNCSAGGFFDHVKRCTRNYMSSVYAVDIGGCLNDSMGVVSTQICLD